MQRCARSTKAPACVLRGHDRIGKGTARLHARGRDFNRPHLRPPGGAPRIHDHARDDDRVPWEEQRLLAKRIAPATAEAAARTVW